MIMSKGGGKKENLKEYTDLAGGKRTWIGGKKSRSDQGALLISFKSKLENRLPK